MNDGPRYVTFRDYLRVVRERRLLVILTALLFAGVGLGYSVRQTPLYAAEASVEFRDEQVDQTIFNRQPASGQTPEQRAAVNAQTITNEQITKRAREILKSPQGPLAVLARPEARTNLVIVEGRAASAERAAAVANAFAEAARDEKREEARERYDDAARSQRRVLRDLRGKKGTALTVLLLRQEIAKFEELARIADPVIIRRTAAAPGAPIRPKPVRTTILGLLIGLTLGIVAAFVRDSLDRRFKSSREITDELHLPLLGYVREDVLGSGLAAGKGRKLLSEEELEGFRIVRTNIEFLDVDSPPKLILVTSALPEEGKSTVSAALAAAYAATDKRTLLVECDLRRPTLAGRLGVRGEPGLSDFLVGRAQPQEILQTISLSGGASNGDSEATATPAHSLVAITAGSPAPQPAELLRSKRCRDFFEQVSEVYDVVIVDTSPLLSVVDTLELLPIAGAVVVCVRASQTTREQARAAAAALAHFPDRPTGIVVTGIRAQDEAGYGGYYSYGYAYGSKR